MNFQEVLHSLLSQEEKRHTAIKRKETTLPVTPYHIYVEPTNACFLKCEFCTEPARKGDRIGYLTKELWQRMADSLAAEKIKAPINLIGRGEPLMHKKLPEFVEYGAEKGLNCSIITNGVLLKKSMGKRLIRAGIKKINFSLHSHSPETYKKITGYDYYERVKQNILDLIETNEKHGKSCFIGVMSVENSINKHESEAFIDYWSKIADNSYITPLYSVQGESYMANEAFETTFSEKEAENHPGCVNPFIFLGVRYDGSMIVCPYDFPGKFIVGSLLDKDYDLMKVWNSKKVCQLRDSQFSHNFDYCEEINYPCKTCDVPFAPDSYKGIGEYTQNFPIVFSRMFGPILRNA